MPKTETPSTIAHATYADFLAVPDEQVAELIGGVLYVSPRPAVPHAIAASNLGGELYGPFRRGRGGPGGWILLFEPEFRFGQPDPIVVPDLAGWRVANFPADGGTAKYFTAGPDWICEVISPRSERLDRATKAAIYAGSGVGHLWLINPIARTLEVLRLNADRHWELILVASNEDVVRAEPFQDLALELSALWVADAPQD